MSFSSSRSSYTTGHQQLVLHQRLVGDSSKIASSTLASSTRATDLHRTPPQPIQAHRSNLTMSTSSSNMRAVRGGVDSVGDGPPAGSAATAPAAGPSGVDGVNGVGMAHPRRCMAASVDASGPWPSA